MKKKLCMVLSVICMWGAVSFLMIKPSSDAEKQVTEDQITAPSLVQSVYAAPKKDKGKGGKKDKGGKGGKKDKDRGPSVPAIPMAAAVLIGLGGIGAGAYFLKKKKK